MYIPLETVVRHKKTGNVGVTAPQIFPDLEGSVGVVYDGYDSYVETMPDDLEVVGAYEAPIPDPEAAQRCGAGSGAGACRYLTMQPGGFKCARFSTLRNTLIFAKMNANGIPKHRYPECQDDILAAIAANDA